ncbi:MAG: hypothetical protein ABSC06_40295 [Rhodopila sp.]
MPFNVGAKPKVILLRLLGGLGRSLPISRGQALLGLLQFRDQRLMAGSLFERLPGGGQTEAGLIMARLFMGEPGRSSLVPLFGGK